MICDRCVNIESLKKIVIKNGRYDSCAYCKSQGVCVEKSTLFEYIADRFEESYISSDELSAMEHVMVFECGSDTPRVFEYWEPLSDTYSLGHEDFVGELVDALEPRLGKGNSLYALNDGSREINDCDLQWQQFIDDIHYGRRFFNEHARDFLDSLFLFACDEARLKPELLATLSQTAVVYRARKIDDAIKLEAIEKHPIYEMGPPPRDKASSQRMTPRGIAALYCAADRDTCLSELRPIAGDIMVSAGFSPLKPMNFFDLRKLEKLSKKELMPFDQGFSKAEHAHAFLTRLITKMSQPNTGKDDLAYLSTQVVFEYLRTKFKSQVHGLAFPSVQTGGAGLNFVIFPEFSAVAPDSSQSSKTDESPFELQPTFMCIKGSLRIHQIKAVHTCAKDFDSYYGLRTNDPVNDE